MNGIIIIDKPAGWTSHDVVAKLRGMLKEKRIGHSGTLDPMATGVLPVFIGRATRAVQFCESDDKEYIAGLRLGLVTDTQDTTGTILSEADVKVSRLDVERAVMKFTGVQEQLPPMYSAVKVGGQKLYQLARRGVEAERKPRRIMIEAIEVLLQTEDEFLLRIRCSKGTYIRTLCHDIGRHLGCGGAMSSLRRVRAGSFSEDEAVLIADVEKAVSEGRVGTLIKPVDSLFTAYPAVYINARQKAKCLNGAEFTVDLGNGLFRVYDGNHNFLMLGQAEGGIMRTVKSFFDV
jgi:tRNA pseudouridine55 synthase